MKKDDRDWLINLQGELWEFHPPRGRDRFGHTTEIRNLTEDEWERLKTLMGSEGDLIFSLGTQFGFTLQLSILECGVYPGADSTFLLRIGQKQIPVEGIDGATLGGAGESWQIAWDLLTPFTHSEENAKKLKYHKMQASRERVHYEY